MNVKITSDAPMVFHVIRFALVFSPSSPSLLILLEYFDKITLSPRQIRGGAKLECINIVQFWSLVYINSNLTNVKFICNIFCVFLGLALHQLKNYQSNASALNVDCYPDECQFDVSVTDVSPEILANEGDFLKCLDLSTVDVDLNDGDLVLIEMGEGKDKQIHVKRLRRLGERYEFWPLEDGQVNEENVIVKNGHNHERPDFKVIAKVLWIYNVWQSDKSSSKKVSE